MSHKTLTRAEIASHLSENLEITKQKASRYIGDMIDIMMEGIIHEGTLKLSSFGSFIVLEKGSRIGRNPKTGQEVMIGSRKSISFRPSHMLKECILYESPSHDFVTHKKAA